MVRLLLSVLFFSSATFSLAAEEMPETEKAEQASTEQGAALTVSINGLNDESLQKNAEAFLAVFEENGKTVKNPSYTEFLIKTGSEQIQQALQPFGYYSAIVDTQINKTPNSWTVDYQVSKGNPVIAKTVEVAIDGEGQQQKEYQELLAKYPIKVGDVLVQQKYKDFKGDLEAAATTYGYFDAGYTKKSIHIHEDYRGADIHLTYDTGQRYQFGSTTIEQDFLDPDVFERFITYEAGDAYSSKTLGSVQRDLYNSNYVKMIDVTAEPVKGDKSVPVHFTIQPKANKKHTFAIGYGTDTGARTRYDFDWRWVNRRGHQFKSKIYLAEKVQEMGAQYRIPAARPATDYYKIFTDVRRDHSGDNESLMWNVGGAYHDKVGNWKREFGIKWQQEDFELGNDSGNIGLLTPYTVFTYRKVDDPLDVSRGLFLQGKLTGAHESMLSDTTFLQAVATAKVVRRLNKKHKVKLGAAIGQTWVDDFHELPTAYRFFTGGDRTIRGYKFHKIGDRDSSGDNVGGDRMYHVSAEYEYFFREKMAAAAFVDAGDAFSEDSAALKVGAGVGFHYYSPIGPIRIDVAHGFDEPGDDIRLHLNIGPEL